MTTLTVDGSPEESGELSAEEQDSLAVGEQMAQEQESLYAGKYKNAEELESAYIELQKKLGSSDDEDSDNDGDESEDTSEESTSILDELWEQSQSEFKEETLEKLRGMDPTELANMYLQYRNNASQQEPQARDMPQEVVTQLKSIVGGDANYKNMTEWASSNLSEQEIAMFDKVMDFGDPNACLLYTSPSPRDS